MSIATFNRPLLIGDPVRLYIDNISIIDRKKSRKAIGIIRYIGFIPGPSSSDTSLHNLTQYIGIELLKPIDGGHSGIINKIQYFNTQKGYGIHVPIINIIDVLSTANLVSELKNTLSILHQKNTYIKDLESIINTQKAYANQPLAETLLPIDVNIPTSKRSTFILPAAITPFTPNTKTASMTNTPITKTTEEYSISSTLSDTAAFGSYIETTVNKDIDINSVSNQYSPSPHSRSPFTPTPQYFEYKRSGNRRKSVKNKTKRLQLLMRKPVPEFRADVDNKRSKKKKKMITHYVIYGPKGPRQYIQ